jgi:hypothetical protein
MTPGFRKPEGAQIDPAARLRVVTVSCSMAAASPTLLALPGQRHSNQDEATTGSRWVTALLSLTMVMMRRRG